MLFRSSGDIGALARRTEDSVRAALDDDLNTAQALGAMFDMVREANAQADAGKLRKDDAAPLLAVLRKFDEVFAILSDDDAAKVQRVREWAKGEGKWEGEAAPAGLSDAEVEALIAERDRARRARDFKKSDSLRDQLAQAGIVLEDTKDGVRWKRR